MPFGSTSALLRLPPAGFEVRERGPWLEDRERWRRLVVRFPADVPAHSREQTYYFDEHGLLRRLDYGRGIRPLGSRRPPLRRTP